MKVIKLAILLGLFSVGVTACSDDNSDTNNSNDAYQIEESADEVEIEVEPADDISSSVDDNSNMSGEAEE